jgi:hypothetical protein
LTRNVTKQHRPERNQNLYNCPYVCGKSADAPQKVTTFFFFFAAGAFGAPAACMGQCAANNQHNDDTK